VPNAENESISSNPIRISWIVAHHFLEQQVGHWSQTDCSSRVSVAYLLDGISGENAGGVNCPLVNLAPVEFAH
jgi:hypothetical protein